MCGIAAYFGYGISAPPIDREALFRVSEAMYNRGPDGAGHWLSKDGRVGLAHRRLAIIDLTESAAQPMSTEDGLIHLVFNGEIYNYRHLRARLESVGYRFRSNSDTEVLLRLYQEHGRDMLRFLRGMFAIALWDDRRKGLFLARDHFGIKPLYLSDDGVTVRVASQVKALLKDRSIDSCIERAGLVGFHLWGHVPEPYTLYKGIRSLPAGSSLWIELGGKRIREDFFDINALIRTAKSRPLISPMKMQEGVNAVVLDSVGRHLESDVAVGIFLSAGVDSTCLAAAACGLNATPIHTVTLGFEEYRNTIHDEVPIAEATARSLGTHHYTRWLRREEFIEERTHVLQAMDQPSIDGVNTYFVSKAAKEAGLKVVLSGVGGDELFAGYSNFRRIPRIVRWLRLGHKLPRFARGLREVFSQIPGIGKGAGLFEYGGTYGGAYLLARSLNAPWALDMLDPETVEAGLRELRSLEMLNTIAGVSPNPRLKISNLEIQRYMRNQLLRDSDWAGMAHSVEIRTPFVDREVFRMILDMSSGMRSPGKKELLMLIPEPIRSRVIARKKTGFSVPIGPWLSNNKEGKLHRWAQCVIQEQSGVAAVGNA